MKHLARMMLLGLTLGLPVPAIASVQSNSGIHADRVNECRQRRKDADASYCECIVKTSEDITENDPILEVFLSSEDKELLDKRYENLVSGDAYNNHNFSSVKEKKEYIAGRGTLFVRRIEARCKEK